METGFWDVILAATPPLAVLVLMVGFQWGGSKAGIVGWIIALVLAVLHFGAGGKLLLYAHVRSLVTTFDVVYIIWMSLLLYLVVDLAGGLKVIARWFTDLTQNGMLRILLLGWVFTSFLQGVGGFGVPVAIVAPILVGLGLTPLAAVVIPSIGHGWSVTFGSMGSSFIAMMNVTGLEEGPLAPPAAVLLGVAALGCGLLVAHAYAGWRGLKHAIPAVLVIGVVMAAVQYGVAVSGLWSIGAACGGLAGLAVGLWVTRWPMYRRAQFNNHVTETPEDTAPEQNTRPVPSFPMAITGYAILVVLAVLVTGIFKDFFDKACITFSVPEVATSKDWLTAGSRLNIRLLEHAGAVLLYSSLITYFIYRAKGFYAKGAGKAMLRGTWKKGANPALGILSMVAMATVMANSGMTQTLAIWLGQIVPSNLYAFVATAIGALGAFMTGSNTNSNVVFSDLQMRTAQELGLSVVLILGTQTASGAIASFLAPAKIMVGASTVGMSGDEGRILRSLLLYGGALLLLIAVLSFVLIQLGAYT